MLFFAVQNVSHGQCAPDVSPPTASNPVTIDIECISEVPLPDVNVVTDEADVCSLIPLVTWEDDLSDGGICPETITRRYRITDDSGNWIFVTQFILVNDITPPVASNPNTINVANVGLIPAPNVLDVTSETDNCMSNPIVAFVSDVTDGDICNGETITRTYSVTDNCGNLTLVTQQIMIDAVLPNVNAGVDQTFCEGEMVILNGSGATFYSWDIGVVDGVPFVPSLGITTHTVTGTDANGCVNTDQANISVTSLPIVSFTSDTPQGCNSTVTFTNTSTAVSAMTNCEWSFEAAPSTVLGCNEVLHTFPGVGIYDVSLSIQDSEGCTNFVTYSDFVNISNVSNIDSSVSVIGSSIYATASGYTYQWIDCLNGNLPLPGETNQSFSPVVAGTYAVNISDGQCTSQSGCIVIGAFSSIDNSISVNGATITATASGYNYQWMDVSNNFEPIIGETNQSLTVAINGLYAVRISDATDEVQSDIVNMQFASIEELELSNISLYPNPASGEITIDLKKTYSSVEVEVINLNGRVFSSDLFNQKDKLNLILNGAPGVYFIKIQADGYTRTMRVIKE